MHEARNETRSYMYKWGKWVLTGKEEEEDDERTLGSLEPSLDDGGRKEKMGEWKGREWLMDMGMGDGFGFLVKVFWGKL